MGDRFCPSCGRPSSDCSGCARAFDPPHFCAACGVRMAVQVTPTGWRARCREHGAFDQT